MSKSEIEELVRQEGMDAVAEEYIIAILAARYGRDKVDGYINTDLWRAQIRKAQGRKRRT